MGSQVVHLKVQKFVSSMCTYVYVFMYICVYIFICKKGKRCGLHGRCPSSWHRLHRACAVMGRHVGAGTVSKSRGSTYPLPGCLGQHSSTLQEAFLNQMHRAGDHRTLVVPTITALDPDTWEENRGSSSQACYMTWNADFTWLLNPGRDVPIMSGGLLAISRRWWEETGGYDDHMIAWGGENIDQSLRSWLCGGRIEVADGAFVAHMWRDPNNPKTQLKYTMRTEDVMRNKARAVSGWLGPYANKTFTFPEYEAFFNGENSIGDLSNFDQLHRKLNCAPFSAYLHRFSYIYVDGGFLAAFRLSFRTSTFSCF